MRTARGLSPLQTPPPERSAILRDAFADAIEASEHLAKARNICISSIDDALAPGDSTALANRTPETLKELSKYINAGSEKWRQLYIRNYGSNAEMHRVARSQQSCQDDRWRE